MGYLIVLLVPILVLFYYIFATNRSYYYCFRAFFIAVGICAVCFFPIGKMETRQVKIDKDDYITSSKYLYVVPCQHIEHATADEVHITPTYTSLITASFSDDLKEVAYCDKCHTRKEAIHIYFAKR